VDKANTSQFDGIKNDYDTRPILVLESLPPLFVRIKSVIKLPHSILADQQLSILPKVNAFTNEHANLLILQRAHPTSPERLVPILPLLFADLFHHIDILTVLAYGRRPFALKPADEEARCDDAVARNVRREGVVAQCATDGARRALSKRGAYLFVGRYLPRRDSPDQIVHRPVVWRDALASLGAERVAFGARQGIVDVSLIINKRTISLPIR
jgi:hypothetical protein